MILTEHPEQVSEVMRQVRKAQGFGNVRTGIHVSDLVYCLMKSYFRHTAPVPIVEPDEVTLMWLLGRGHHGILEIGASEIGFEQDGIVGTVDLLRMNSTGEAYPVEIKTTRQSTNRPIIDQTHWFQQLTSYACMMNTTFGQLWVMYLNGNYKPPTPIMKVFSLRWTEGELNGWWNEMLRRRRLLEAMLTVPREEAQEHPEEFAALVAHHHSWECGYCQFKKDGLCEGGEGVNEGYLVPSMGVQL